MRTALILPVLPALLAWTFALAVARASGPQDVAMPSTTTVAVHLDLRPAEPDEPLALIAPIPSAAPASDPAQIARAEPVARVAHPGPLPDRTTVVAAIEAAAREFGQDPAFLVAVAFCESRLNPGAVGKAGELGVLQFMPSTFAKNGARLGYGLVDIWDVRAQARVAAEMFTRQQQWQWTCARVAAR